MLHLAPATTPQTPNTKHQIEGKIKMSIILTTGDLKKDYEILDLIFEMGAHKAGFFEISANPNSAFDKIREQLKSSAAKLSADAVINCQFEYRVAVTPGMLGGSQVMEIFAYGTAVKFK